MEIYNLSFNITQDIKDLYWKKMTKCTTIIKTSWRLEEIITNIMIIYCQFWWGLISYQFTDITFLPVHWSTGPLISPARWSSVYRSPVQRWSPWTGKWSPLHAYHQLISFFILYKRFFFTFRINKLLWDNTKVSIYTI
jgi:hypothetical protein